MFRLIVQNFMAHKVAERNLECREQCTAICQSWVPFEVQET